MQVIERVFSFQEKIATLFWGATGMRSWQTNWRAFNFLDIFVFLAAELGAGGGEETTNNKAKKENLKFHLCRDKLYRTSDVSRNPCISGIFWDSCFACCKLPSAHGWVRSRLKVNITSNTDKKVFRDLIGLWNNSRLVLCFLFSLPFCFSLFSWGKKKGDAW